MIHQRQRLWAFTSVETPVTVSRRYPLEPDNHPNDHAAGTGDTSQEPSNLIQLAAFVASGIVAFREWRWRHPDLFRAAIGTTLLALGVALASISAITDSYLHRGVETGAEEPYVVQPTGKDHATNIDMRVFPADEQDVAAATLREMGIGHARQEFSWADIEPEQENMQWDEYDAIVDTLTRHNIGIVAVVTDVPDWAAADLVQADADARPASPDTFGAFFEELTARYGESIGFVQAWDRPNLDARWGGDAASGEEFFLYQAAAWNGAKAGNAEVRVLTPELEPDTASLQDPSDIEFLRELLEEGGEPFIDIVGITLDGGTLSPDDRRVSSTRENFSRAILYRDVLLDYDQTEVPIWATSFGWAANENVSREEQAEYVARAQDRIWSEWPWMGLAFQWSFVTAEDGPNAAYAVVQPDGSPTPLYQRLVSPDMQERADRANTGFVPMDFAAFSYQGNWQDQLLENRAFRTTSQVDSSATIEFEGTGAIAYLRSGPNVGNLHVRVDGELLPGGAGDDGTEWDISSSSGTNDLPFELVSGLDDGHHVLEISLASPGEMTLGGLVIERDEPFIWPIMLMTAGAGLLLFFAARSYAYLVAERTGYLRRRVEGAPLPPPPLLPNWRSGRRV